MATLQELEDWYSTYYQPQQQQPRRLSDLAALDPSILAQMQQDNAIGGDAGVQYVPQQQMQQPMPENYIQSSSGRTISLPSIQQQGGMSLSDLLNKTGASIKDKVILSDKGEGYRTPYGSVAGLDSNGRMWEVDKPQPRRLTTKEMKDYFEMLKTQKEVEAFGKVKPTLVDGQWVYPPSEKEPSGRAVKVQGFEGKEKKLTADEAKNAGYGIRAATSSEIIDAVGKEGDVQPGLIKRSLEAVPWIGQGLGTMANVTQSPEQQKVEQAQRDFINAVLRRESGAVISDQEFDNARKQYFPQPGDSTDVIAQKKMNRTTTIDSLALGAGAGAGEIDKARSSIQEQLKAAGGKKGAGRNMSAPVPVTSEAAAMSLPKGTVFILNGRKGVVD